MAIKSGDLYLCSYCGSPYKNAEKADECRQKHDLIYLQLSRRDLASLCHFVYSKEDTFLTDTLMNVLNRFMKSSGEEVVVRGMFETDTESSN